MWYSFLSVEDLFNYIFCLVLPLQNVIDGDICEQYNSIDPNKQRAISEELDRTSSEVAKKLEDIRTRFAF
jgi:splicing factor 3B subunit 3